LTNAGKNYTLVKSLGVEGIPSKSSKGNKDITK